MILDYLYNAITDISMPRLNITDLPYEIRLYSFIFLLSSWVVIVTIALARITGMMKPLRAVGKGR
jgi:hypothetical protein